MATPVSELARKAEEALSRFNQAEKFVAAETKRRKEVRKRWVRTNKAQQILQDIAKAVQEKVHTGIAKIVTRCIQTVFQDDPEGTCEFQIKFERKRGKTEARLVFTRDGEEFNPIEEDSGGYVDVAAFALRLACICMEKPRRRKVLFLDEPFKFVSEEYRPYIGQLLLDLAKELDFQIVMVTHLTELQIGHVVRL